MQCRPTKRVLRIDVYMTVNECFAQHGYHIYLTADHGNVDADGIGRLSISLPWRMADSRAAAMASRCVPWTEDARELPAPFTAQPL